MGDLSPKPEKTRKLLTTQNIKEYESIQKPPYLHQNQLPTKSQEGPEQDIPHKFYSNAGT